MYPTIDAETFSAAAADTSATRLRSRFEAELQRVQQAPLSAGVNGRSTRRAASPLETFEPGLEPAQEPPPRDVKALWEHAAVEALRADQAIRARIEAESGVAWGTIKHALKNHLPTTLLETERDALAHQLVPKALSAIYGPQGTGWHSFKHPERLTAYVRAGRKSAT
jgi:hypothetical protein